MNVKGILARARSLWRALLRRSDVEASMDEEFGIHVEMRTEHLIRSGMKPREAARRARMEFGSTERYKEEGREARGLRILDEIHGDLRYGVRTLLRSPGFTAVVVLTLGLGVGATTAIFSALDAVLLRPLPFAAPHRLVQLSDIQIPFDPGTGPRPKSLPDIGDARALEVFSHVAAYAPGGLNLSGQGTPRRIQVGVVTPGFFETLGVRPAAGRTFGPEEGVPDGPRAVIVSHGFWRANLGGDTDLEGRVVTLNGRDYRVVGVAPRGFAFPEEAEVWLPMSVPTTWATWEPFRQFMPSRVIARLAPGMEAARAEAAAQAMFVPYQRSDRPDWATPDRIVTPLRTALVGGRSKVLLILLGATALVLLVACANVANLLLSRATVRQREMAVRSTLGATPSRVARQLMAESLLLALAGGAVGVALALGGVRALEALVPPALSGATPLQTDLRVLAFALVVTVATGVAFGLAPALAARRTDAGEVLKGSGPGAATGVPSATLRRTLLVGEVALTVLLVVGASVMLRSLQALLATDPGLQADRVATLELTLAEAEYPTSVERRQFYERLVERLDAIPQVQAAGVINELPLRGAAGVRFLVYPEGRRPEQMDLKYMAQDLRITPDYFRAMGIRVLAGRAPLPQPDTLAPGEVAISESLARMHWPDRSPLGQRLELPGDRLFEIVGVVADVRPTTLESEVIPQAYYSLLDTPYDNAAVVARGSLDGRVLARVLEEAVRDVAPGQAVYNVRTMDEVISRAIAPRRTNTALIAAFGLLALVLATVGVYGVIAFSVARRTREIGIRMALGADARRIRRGVVGEALALAGLGAALGLFGAWVAAGVLEAVVYGVAARDPLSFVAAPAAVLMAAALAALVPARRATRVDPTEAIREA